ncbi:MAG: PAS domain S-box protein [Deltaproteobacteria bacterium]|nr:PAS domain S-box protein [Deltaproteobacteria bacterium]
MTGRVFAGNLLLAAAYVATGLISLQLARFGTNVSPIWPPLGIAIAVLMRAGPGYWPGVAVGALVVNLLSGVGPLIACGIAVGNTAAPFLVARTLGQGSGFDRAFTRQRDILRFSLVSTLGASLSALGGSACLLLGGQVGSTSWLQVFLIWWMGDLVGAHLVGPFVLLAGRERWRRVDYKGRLSVLLILIVAALVGGLVFLADRPRPLVFLAVVPIVWAALRIGPWAGAGTVLIMAGLAAFGSAFGRGPFGALPRLEAQLLVAAFVETATLLNLLIRALQGERSQIEAHLHSANELQKAVLDATHYSIISSDAEGRILLFNRGAERLLGYRAAEVVGRHSPLLFHEPGDLQRRSQRMADELGDPSLSPPEALARTLETGRRDEGEAVLVRKDGSRVQVWLTMVALRDRDGRVTGSLGIGVDLSERQSLDTVRRENEARWRLYAEATEDAIWEWELGTGQVTWSGAIERRFGYAPAELSTDVDAWAQLIHPDDRDRVVQSLEAVQHNRARAWTEEYRLLRKDGSYAWVLDRGVVMRDPDDRVVRMLGAVLDQTSRKQAELAVLESRARLAGIIDSAIEGIITIDEAHRIVVFNPAAEAIFRWPAHEAIGHPLERLIPERDRTVHQGHIGNFATEPGPPRRMSAARRVHGLRADGTEVPLEASIAKNRVGQQMTYTVSVRDLTERVEAEGRQAHLEAQLRSAQKLEAIGTLAGGIAHDFNNILGAIMGNVELAQGDVPRDSPAIESLNQIQKATLRARDLVRQILAFSRQAEAQRALVDLGAVLNEAWSLLRPTLPTTVELIHSVEPGLPRVLADASQLHQVVVNLCTNALHALPGRAGRIEVSVRARSLDDAEARAIPGLLPGAYVCLSVTDNGVGIEEKVLERMFEPFFTTKAPGEGTGLGLAVAHGIVLAHGGVIRVHSRPGSGATFEVLLPVAQPAAPVPGVAPASPAASGQGQRIWLIDDEPALTATGKRLLERMGYQVRADLTAEQALECLAAAPSEVDLLVTDLTMPHVNGLELTERALKIRPDLPIILVTGFPGQLSDEDWRRHGITEVVLKPYSRAAMAAAVERALEKNKP